MIIKQDKSDVQVNGAGRTQEFKMKASAKAYKMLMDGMYSHKHESMCREIFANGFDSHVAAGCPETPIDVKLPTALDPSFYIRDYGTGISDNDMYNIYTTVFESTKENTNDQIGAFGIGKLSFYSVSNSATITSYYNNYKTVYIAYLNEENIPTLSTFSSNPSEEPTGLKVEIAAKREDFYSFKEAVLSQLKYFPTKPNILGDADFQWNKPHQSLFKGDDWQIISDSSFYGLKALQGNISYPISKSDIRNHDLQNIIDLPILLNFDIGDININPSRESLSYDKPTIEIIQLKLSKIKDQLLPQIKKFIDNSTSEWNARVNYDLMDDDLGSILRNFNDAEPFTYEGINISSTYFSIYETPDDKFILSANEYNYKHQLRRFKRSTITRSYDHDKYKWNIYINSETFFYADENEKNIEARIKDYASKNNISSFKLFKCVNDSFDTLIRKLGNPSKSDKTIINVKDLPQVKRIKKPKSNDIVIKEYYGGWSKASYFTSKTVDDIKELDGFFFEIKRFDAINDTHTIYDVKKFVDSCSSINIKISKPIYGLNKLQLKQLKKEHNLINFFDYIQDEINKMDLFKLSNPLFDSFLEQSSSVRDDIISKTKKDTPIYKIAKAVSFNSRVEFSPKKQQRFIDAGITLPFEDVEPLVKECKDLYPMLKAARYYHNNTQIIDYIDMVNNNG